MSTASGTTAKAGQQMLDKGKIPSPEKFSGERSKLRTFLTSMSLHLRFNSGIFQTQQDKVLAAGMFMKDEALEWFQPYMQDYLEHASNTAQCKDDTKRIFRDYAAFEKEIKNVFGIIDEQRAAALKLRQLQQVGAASDYTTKFRQISSRLDWDDDPLMNQYYVGLKDSVKDEIARQEWPDDMERMIELAVRIDTRLHERKLEKRTGQGVQRTRQGNREDPGDPMELDRVKGRKFQKKKTNRGPTKKRTMSQEQRERFEKGACIQCGEKGHFARDCRKKVRMIRSQRDPLREHRHRLDTQRCWVCGSEAHLGQECP